MKGREDEEAEDAEPIEDGEEKEQKLARSIRIMDVGIVKRGEPEVLQSRSGKQELKKFLLSDRRKPAQ